MNEDKAARYHRLRRRTVVLGLFWSAGLLVTLLATGGSLVLRDVALALVAALGVASSLVPVAAAAAFAVSLALLHETIALPLAYYAGFVVERRYGLSRQTARAWLWDYLKASLIALALSVAASCAVYALLAAWPRWWWIAAWAGFVGVSFGLAHLAPVILMPLFFVIRPLGRESLRERLTALAERAGLRVVGVYEWTLSDRTRKVNAALAGLGRTRRILLGDTLLSDYSDDEIEVILAHELAHQAHHDIRWSLAYETLLALGGFLVADRFLTLVIGLLGLDGPTDVAGLPALLLGGGVLSILLVPAANLVSRRHERRADLFALEATGNAPAFISAMRRMGLQNLAEESPSVFARSFFYTHPPVPERIRMAQEWAAARARTP